MKRGGAIVGAERSLMRLLVIMLTLSLALASAQEGVEENQVVLRVGEAVITRAEFDQRFTVFVTNIAAQQGLPLNAETLPLLNTLRPIYLDQLVTEQALLREAQRRHLTVPAGYVEGQLAGIRANFASDEAYQEALARAGFASEALLATLISEASLLDQVITALQNELDIKDHHLQLWYDNNRAQLEQPAQACARHILVADEGTANALKAELQAGADFAALAQANSLDGGSAPQGGDLGCFPRGAMVAPFEEVAFTAPLDVVSAPVRSQFGYHLILPYNRTPAYLPPLSEVEARVRAAVEQEVLAALLRAYREGPEIEVFAERITEEKIE